MSLIKRGFNLVAGKVKKAITDVSSMENDQTKIPLDTKQQAANIIEQRKKYTVKNGIILPAQESEEVVKMRQRLSEDNQTKNTENGLPTNKKM